MKDRVGLAKRYLLILGLLRERERERERARERERERERERVVNNIHYVTQ